MPGLEYIEHKDWREDNPLYDPGRAFALDIGVRTAGWGMRKRGMTQDKRAGDLWGRITSPGTTREEWSSGYSRYRQLRNKGAANVAYGRSLRRFANVFGGIAFAQLGFMAGKGLFSLGESFRTTKEEIRASRREDPGEVDNTYFDSRAAYTQRMRALQVIHNSRLSMKPALGNEASYLHY